MKRMKKFRNLKKMKNLVKKNLVKKKVSITRRKMIKRKMNVKKKRINVMKMRVKVRMMNFVAIINKKQITLMYGMNNILIDIIIHFNILLLFVYGANIM